MPLIVKKYPNRRLYDTDESRYITLDELTDKIKRGADVQILDAKSNEDLTRVTLLQVIVETKGAALLPTPVLAKLIRLDDDALGEFFGKYLSGALELYLTAKQGAQAVSPYFPFATTPFTAANAMARMMNGMMGQVGGWPDAGFTLPGPPVAAAAPAPTPAPGATAQPSDIDALRGELEALRREVHSKAKARPAARGRSKR
ncbi:MAG: polyhydroxyalkanoate synthesis regulator DNA-binding domain-containing protein [Polyangiaceae bacterium]